MEQKSGIGRKIGDFMFLTPKRGINGFGILLLALALAAFVLVALLSYHHTGPFPLPK